MVTAPRRPLAQAFVAMSFALIALMTMQPTTAIVITPTFCVFCGPLGGVDFILNVILFVPFGASLRWTTGRWQTTAIIGAATTLAIEALQARVIPGRDASIGDLVANTLGTLLGAWLATAVPRWLNATATGAVRLAAAFGIIASLVVTASAVLLQPIVPHYVLWVQWTPHRPNLDPFKGELIGAEVRGRALHPRDGLIPKRSFDTLTRSASIRAHIGAAPPPTKRLAIIVRIANDLEEGFSLGQWGDAAAFRTYTAASRVSLRSLLVGLDGAFSSPPANSSARDLVIEGHSDPRAMTLRTPDGEKSVSLRRTVGLAWALIIPEDVALNTRWWPANAIWLAVLILPVSLFAVRSRRTETVSRFAGWPVVLVIATLIATPLTGLSPLSVGEWAGVLAGIAGGWTLERMTSPAPMPLDERLKGAL